MKRYNANQIRVICNLLIVVVIAIGLYLIWLFPAVHSSTNDFGQRREFQKNSPHDLLNTAEEISVAQMQTYLASLQQAGTGPDPFLSPGEQQWKRFLGALKDRPPRLEGIIQVEGARVALINSAAYREGERIGEFTVIAIADSEVVLAKQGARYTIHLSQ